MRAAIESIRRAVPVIVFLGIFQISDAHPGPPGHFHPDEVDEFDQVAHVESPAESGSGVNIGGLLVLLGLAGCLGFAFLQKQGGIWSDVTTNH